MSPKLTAYGWKTEATVSSLRVPHASRAKGSVALSGAVALSVRWAWRVRDAGRTSAAIAPDGRCADESASRCYATASCSTDHTHGGTEVSASFTRSRHQTAG